MAYLGHPVLGDPVYGGDGAAFVEKHPSLFDGQMLHAQSLTLTHPRTGEKMTFHAPLPDNFEDAPSRSCAKCSSRSVKGIKPRDAHREGA